ncbi:MAG: ATP-binding protein [Acidobacteriota bacterium]|nr:ATP-binding protein [Acidobacteriota bacterium]
MEPISGVTPRSERDGILRRIKLVGEPEAMAWVARTLSAGGLLVERHDEKEVTDPEFFSHWPLVWVTRPEAFGRGFVRLRPAILDIAPRPPLCLVVVPPDTEITDQLVRRIAVESFELVRERDEGPLLAMRLERLLLLQRRRSEGQEKAFKERLRTEAKRNDILASIALASRDSLDLEEVLGAATSLLGTRFAANSVEIWFLNEDASSCTVFMDWREGDASSSLVGYERPLPESEPFRTLVASLEPYVVADRSELDAASLAFSALEALGAKSLVGIPIHREGEVIGVLGMSWPEPRAFPPDEIVFFGRVADQLALAIRAARLYGNLQKQLEALALEQRRRELADRDRSRLTAMLVHDMKNPLSALTAALELTRDKERKAGDARLAKMLDGSLASARGLQGLIEDALLVYRASDAPETEKRPTAPTEALSLPLEEARWLAVARRVTIEVDVPADLPRVPLDPAMFRRAAANLFGNAVKFSPPGGTVRVKAEIVSEEGRPFLRVSVTDEGPGFPAAERSRIATPYLRFQGSEAVPGTGLGLTVVQKVLQAHRGRLDVANNEGGPGSTFTLWIPA